MMVLSDSCQDMVIENCYISVGDDAIAIKSGWDHYGIAYGRPSTNILIRDLIVRSEVRSVVYIYVLGTTDADFSSMNIYLAYLAKLP